MHRSSWLRARGSGRSRRLRRARRRKQRDCRRRGAGDARQLGSLGGRRQAPRTGRAASARVRRLRGRRPGRSGRKLMTAPIVREAEHGGQCVARLRCYDGADGTTIVEAEVTPPCGSTEPIRRGPYRSRPRTRRFRFVQEAVLALAVPRLLGRLARARRRATSSSTEVRPGGDLGEPVVPHRAHAAAQGRPLDLLAARLGGRERLRSPRTSSGAGRCRPGRGSPSGCSEGSRACGRRRMPSWLAATSGETRACEQLVDGRACRSRSSARRACGRVAGRARPRRRSRSGTARRPSRSGG